MRKIGNLFELAEKRLIMEKKEGIIPCYGVEDIIEYAIEIRKFLDRHPDKVKKALKMTTAQIKENRNNRAKQYYLKKKRFNIKNMV